MTAALSTAAYRQGFTVGVLDLPTHALDWGLDAADDYRRGIRDGRARRGEDPLPRPADDCRAT